MIEVDPEYPDGPVNVARALLQEGDVTGAIPYLERAIALEPRLARAHFFLGTARKTLGAYDEALAHLEIAREQYPRDRVVLGQIGRIQFLDRRFDEAVATFQEVLRIDPEDLQAHYNLMLAHRGAGDVDAANPRAGALRALQGRTRRRRQSRDPTGGPRRRTTTSGRRSTSTGTPRCPTESRPNRGGRTKCRSRPARARSTPWDSLRSSGSATRRRSCRNNAAHASASRRGEGGLSDRQLEGHRPGAVGRVRRGGRDRERSQAGVEILARADVGDGLEVLEGAWPYDDGGVTIERFRSMQALLDFWHSDEYQAAIKLREGAIDIDFIVALEASEATTTDQ